MPKKKTLEIETVHQCNGCFGGQASHPLACVIDLAKAHPEDGVLKFNLYALLLIENACDEFPFGRKYYDYSNATLLFLPPGQPIRLDEGKPLPRQGRLLAFHPRLIRGTTLETHIHAYTFFAYRTEEALHLSSREKSKMMECLDQMDRELQHPVDRHSQVLISRYIELSLDYCSRFYERQFITRCDANRRILEKTETLLDTYIRSGKLRSKVMPTAEYCSGLLSLSPSYFNDLLKFETGKTITEYVQLKRMEEAKKMLLSNEARSISISLIVAELGYPNEAYFSHLFQKMTGMTPEEYRLSVFS